MKTYLLRHRHPVEPQSHRPAPRPAPATVGAILGPPARTPAGRALLVGLDVHSESITVSLAPSGSAASDRDL